MTQPASRVDRFERSTEWPNCGVGAGVSGRLPSANSASRHELILRQLCRVTDYAIWVVFVAEFITRVVLTERHVHYAARHVADVASPAALMTPWLVRSATSAYTRSSRSWDVSRSQLRM